MADNTIGERLVLCRELLDLKPGPMATKLEIAASTLKNIESGLNVPNGETLLRYAALGFNPGWILTGIGDMRLGPASQWQGQTQDSRPAGFAEAPAPWDGLVMVERLAFSASAGNGALVLDELGPSFPVRRELLVRLGLRPEHTCMVEAVGLSMVPTIQDRDVLLVDTSPAARELIREGEIYLFTIDSEAYIKRLRRDVGQWVMVSDNQELFPPRAIPKGEHVQIIGRVCWGARAL